MRSMSSKEKFCSVQQEPGAGSQTAAADKLLDETKFPESNEMNDDDDDDDGDNNERLLRPHGYRFIC